MPQVLPMLAYYAAGQGFWGAVASIIVSAGVAEYQKDSARDKARAAAARAARDRTLTVRSGVAPRKLVLGTARLGGPLMYAEFVGDDEQYLDQIIALTHGEASELLGIYLDDEWLPVAQIASGVPQSGRFSGAEAQAQRLQHAAELAGSATVTLPHVPNGSADVQAILVQGVGDGQTQTALTVSSVVGAVVTFSAPVSGTVTVSYSTDATPDAPLRVQWVLGAADQASTTWSGVATPKWTADHRLRGVSYVRTLMRVEDNAYANGLPNISVVLRGPKGVYDPRVPGSVNYTSNPALLAAWLRTLPRADGGLGVPSTWIDWDSVAAAANVCDELITVRKLDGSGYEQVKRYECHTVLSLDQPPIENLRVILDSMAGDFPYTAGKYRCMAGAFRAAAVTITDADVCGQAPITFAPLVGADQEPPNVVTATIYSAQHNYMETGAGAVRNATYVTQDGDEEVFELDLPATTDERQANYLMGVMLERMRPGLGGTISVTGKGADLALLDTVQLELQGYESLAGKTFEVRRRSNTFNGRYELELREIRASSYALDADRFTAAPAAATSDSTAAWKPVPPSITGVVNATLALSDGTRVDRALVTWAAHPQSMVNPGGWIELRYQSPGSEWTYAPPVQGSETSAYIGPLGVGQVLFIEARARNGLGALSAWSGTAPFTVTGSNEVPPNVSGLAWAVKPGQILIQWDRWDDPAYMETELRVGASWAAGALGWSGAATQFLFARPANGTYTVWAAHRSRSGIYSAVAQSITITVDDGITPGTGADAELLSISASGLAFMFADAAASSTSSPTITFDAVLQNVTGTATWVATAYDGTGASLGTITLGGTGNSRTLSGAQFVTHAGTQYVIVQATLGTLTDRVTVYRGNSGSDAVVALMSNEAHTLPAASNGTVSSYVGSGTVIGVFQGVAALAYDGVGTAPGTWKATTAASNVTVGTLTDSGNTLTVGDHSAMTADRASITFSITGKTTSGAAFAFDKVQSLAKSTAGAAGAAGQRTATMRLYRWSASTPTTWPSGTSTYTWATGAFTAPGVLNGWSLTPPAAVAGQTLWAVDQIVTDTSTTATTDASWTSTTALAVGAAGADGTSGSAGARGSLTGYGFGQYGISNSSWSDGHANRVIDNMLTGASSTATLGTTTHLRIGDTVTLGNGSSYSETKFWSGAAWLAPGTVISGNLLVGGTISGAVNLNITGYGKFEGSNSYSLNILGSTETVTTALLSNTSGGSQYGVIGYSASASRAGVYGYNSSSTNSAGVVGYSPGAGVSGAGGTGVVGNAAISGSGVGVHGVGSALAGSGAGVRAQSLNSANLALDVLGKSQFSDQIASTYNAGAPFVVASSTVVSNLNADLLDGQHGPYYNAAANLTGDIAAARMAANVLAAIGFTPIQQGGGGGQLTNKLYIGWDGSGLRLQVDSTNFAATWPIGISGSAAQLGGSTWASPGAIGSTTPNSVRCSSLRIDVAPNTSTSGGAATFGNLPSGAGAATVVWEQVNRNGTLYWSPLWPVV